MNATKLTCEARVVGCGGGGGVVCGGVQRVVCFGVGIIGTFVGYVRAGVCQGRVVFGIGALVVVAASVGLAHGFLVVAAHGVLVVVAAAHGFFVVLAAQGFFCTNVGAFCVALLLAKVGLFQKFEGFLAPN